VGSVYRGDESLCAPGGEQTLKGTKYLWLWSEEHIPPWRREEFDALRDQDLRICRAWAIKENLRHLWEARAIAEMRAYFTRWYDWAVPSRLEPIIKAAKTLKRHLANIITYAQHRITHALGENINARGNFKSIQLRETNHIPFEITLKSSSVSCSGQLQKGRRRRQN